MGRRKPQPPLITLPAPPRPAPAARPQLIVEDIGNLIAAARLVLGQLPTDKARAVLESIGRVELVLAANKAPAPAAPPAPPTPPAAPAAEPAKE